MGRGSHPPKFSISYRYVANDQYLSVVDSVELMLFVLLL